MAPQRKAGRRVVDGPGPNAGARTSNVVGDFLEHFGVRGMKWGVRRDRSQASGSSPSSDSRNAAQVREKIKQTGGTHSLTNKELQDFITRANLEQQYQRLV